MNTRPVLYFLLSLWLWFAATVRGNVSVSDLFANHMVLQCGVPMRIWGRATAGEIVTVMFNSQTFKTTAGTDGKWMVLFPAQKSGGPFTLEIAGKNKLEISDVLVGDVWVASGQSNMGMTLYPNLPWTHGVTDYQAEIAAANHPTLRFFTIFREASETPKDEIHGIWQTCTPKSAANFSAVAYYFGQSLNRKLNKPIGMIVSAVGSTGIISWLDADQVKQFPQGTKGLAIATQKRKLAGDKMDQYRQTEQPAYYALCRQDVTVPGKMATHPEPYKGYLFQPAGCYNAMIAPITHLPITGFVWYQGEGDTRWASGYTKAFETLIQSWRAVWHEPEAPFLFVQLSAHDAYASNKKLDPTKPLPPELIDNWPRQRLAQAVALELPHTGMAVSCDFGNHTTPHYPDKKPVGERLARLALKMRYGYDIETHGPIAGKAVALGSSLIISFASGGGKLVSKSGEHLAGFEIAGRNKVFYVATATIQGGQVIISSPRVKTPMIARYGWAEYPTMSLYNTAGLPAPPFVRDVGNDHAEADAIKAPAPTDHSTNLPQLHPKC